MKIKIVLILIQLSMLSKLFGQLDTIDFIFRDWYANGCGDKEFNVGDILRLDTLQLNPEVSKNFMKWEFQKDGALNNFYFYKIGEGGLKGQFIGMSDDDVKWEIDTRSSELKINKEGFVSRYKIISLNKSNLTLRKLNKFQPPEIK